MPRLVQTAEFSAWFEGLRDRRAINAVAVRLERLALGYAGDVAPIGEGLSELRIHYGPGYRVYYGRRGDELVIILAGGDKNSQSRDIRAAKTRWTLWKEQNDG